MMKSRIAFLLFLSSLVTACGLGTAMSSLEGKSQLKVLNNALIDDGNVGFRYAQDYPSPGTWIERGGSKFCDGYLTQNESVDYCSSNPPADWKSFTYDGQEYFIQRLAGN